MQQGRTYVQTNIEEQVAELLQNSYEQGVKKLQHLVNQHINTNLPETNRKKLLHRSLNRIKETLYFKVELGLLEETQDKNHPLGRLTQVANEIETLTNLLSLTDKPASTDRKNPIWEGKEKQYYETLLNCERNKWKYRTEREENKNKTWTTKTVAETILKFLDRTPAPDLRRHYEGLETVRWGRNTRPNKPVMVVYRETKLENMLVDRADLDIQEIDLKTQKTGIRFSILPENMVEALQAPNLNTPALEIVPFTTILLDTEMLNTACLLYKRNKLTFQKCVDIAQHI